MTETTARAYVYSGDWVADCPRDDCGNTEFLHRATRRGGPRDVALAFFQCSHCGAQADIVWPGDHLGILAVLSRRPVPGTRNWYPADHPVAVRFGLPHGQTVRDLQDENEEHGVG
ncbi:hypothetical protein [Streptomyces sp. NPDC001781]